MEKKFFVHSNAISATKKKSINLKKLLIASMTLGMATIGGFKVGQNCKRDNIDFDKLEKVVKNPYKNDTLKKDENQFLDVYPSCTHISENSSLWQLNNFPDDKTWNNLSDLQKKEFIGYAHIVRTTLLFSIQSEKYTSEQMNKEISENVLSALGAFDESFDKKTVNQNTIKCVNNYMYRAQLCKKAKHAVEGLKKHIVGSPEATFYIRATSIEKFLRGKEREFSDPICKNWTNSFYFIETMLLPENPKKVEFQSLFKSDNLPNKKLIKKIER